MQRSSHQHIEASHSVMGGQLNAKFFSNQGDEDHEFRGVDRNKEGGSFRERRDGSQQRRVSPYTTRNFGKNMSSEEHFRSIVKLKDTITTIDLAASLRALTRQFSQATNYDSLKLMRNPEMKDDLIAFYAVIEKHLDKVEPSNLHEFTNLFNVYRQNRVDNFISGKLKSKLVKRITTIFTE